MDPSVEKFVGKELVIEGFSQLQAALGEWRSDAAYEEIKELKHRFVSAASLIERGLAKMEPKSDICYPVGDQSDSTYSMMWRSAEGLVRNTSLAYGKQQEIFAALIKAGDEGILQVDIKSMVSSHSSHISVFLGRAEQIGLIRRVASVRGSKKCYATTALVNAYKANAISDQGNRSPPTSAS